MERKILHIDVNNAFLSWTAVEMLKEGAKTDIRTIPAIIGGDLAKTEQIKLIKKFGKHGNMMWQYANGIDNQEVNYIEEKPKGIGNSITLPMDISEIEKIEEVLLALTEQVAYRLRENKMLANVVNVQIRTSEFKDYSHQGKLNTATCSAKIIYEKAKKLLEEMLKEKKKIRLVGVRVDNLIEKYERQKSIEYAKHWAFGRNPKYYNFDPVGGDCTNFVSQCIYAGSGVMNYSQYGWYYRNGYEKSASWTGVEYLHKFLTQNKGIGPYGEEVGIQSAEKGDIIQLSFDGKTFTHSLLIIDKDASKILISTHTQDEYGRNLVTYKFNKIRFIHIKGVRR